MSVEPEKVMLEGLYNDMVIGPYTNYNGENTNCVDLALLSDGDRYASFEMNLETFRKFKQIINAIDESWIEE
jgi:hypothetical protein